MHFPIKPQGILLSSGPHVKRGNQEYTFRWDIRKSLFPQGLSGTDQTPQGMVRAPNLPRAPGAFRQWITLSRMHRVGLLGCPMQGQEVDLMIFVGLFQLRRFYDIGYRALLSIGSRTGRQHARQGCRRKNICCLGQLKLDMKDFYPSMNQPLPNDKQLLKLPRHGYQLRVSHFPSAWLKALQAAHRDRNQGWNTKHSIKLHVNGIKPNHPTSHSGASRPSHE